MARRLAASVATMMVLLLSEAATGQTYRVPSRALQSDDRAREQKLRAALNADAGNLKHYFALADFYQERERIGQADQVLKQALNVAPTVQDVFEKRLLLHVKPISHGIIGTLTQEWLSLDGTNPLPVLIAAGSRLRHASARRGDGSGASETELDLAVHMIDGTLPHHPEVLALKAAKASVLLAKALLTTDPKKQQELAKEAQETYQASADGPPPDAAKLGLKVGSLGPVLAAMLQMPPFGPPGAVRAPEVVPYPRRTHFVPIPRKSTDPPPKGALIFPVPLELVVDQNGKVIQIHVTGSVEGFTDAMANAIQQWEYEPTIVKGQPVVVIIRASASAW